MGFKHGIIERTPRRVPMIEIDLGSLERRKFLSLRVPTLEPQQTAFDAGAPGSIRFRRASGAEPCTGNASNPAQYERSGLSVDSPYPPRGRRRPMVSPNEGSLNHVVDQVADLATQSVGGALPIIQMFWHGAALTRVEQLAMASFVAHGHPVHLHAYQPLERVPEGVRLVDANAILPEQDVFRHAKTGSLALFADWFRYRVLHAKGGIWSDTDVVCLRPLTYGQTEIYAWEDEHQINNAILGLSVGHPLAAWMASCCENPNNVLPYDDGRTRRRKWRRRWLQGNRRANVKWGEYGPSGFTSAARHLGYAGNAFPATHFYPVHYRSWYAVFDGSLDETAAQFSESRAVHLWNEMMRRRPGFDKNGRFPSHSLFEQLCRRYEL